MRIDPKAPYGSPHHPAQVQLGRLQGRLADFVAAGEAIVQEAADLAYLPPDDPRLTREPEPLAYVPDLAVRAEAEEPREVSPDVTAALDTVLAEAGLVEEKPQRKSAARKTQPSGAGTQRKSAAKTSSPRKPKASLAEALAKLDTK